MERNKKTNNNKKNFKFFSQEDVDEIINYVGLKCDKQKCYEVLNSKLGNNIFATLPKMTIKNIKQKIQDKIEGNTEISPEARRILNFVTYFGGDILKNKILSTDELTKLLELLVKLVEYSKQRRKVNENLRGISLDDNQIFTCQLSTVFTGLFLPLCYEVIYKKNGGCLVHLTEGNFMDLALDFLQ